MPTFYRRDFINRITQGLSCCSLLLATATIHSATLPAGYSETRVATGLANPTAMAFAPNGRLFVAEQAGRLRVIRDGQLLAQPFLTVNVNSVGERGLLGIAFDPNFLTNGFVYVYYTTASAPIHNRVSRFTASTSNPDIAAAGSEVVIFELPNLSSATNHNGGAIHFGPDGRLYIAVGENANPSNAPALTTTLGKMLRINRDGSIPSDNPFYNQTTGSNRAIWARGLRNPFTFGFDPVTGRMHINDVGQSAWEEVNFGAAGSDYGWPATEGPEPPGAAGVRYPIYSYQNAGSNCAVVGAAFYNPPVSDFPTELTGSYFFGDFCGGFIRYLSPPTYTAVTNFASGISQLVDLHVAADGTLYYLARGGGEVFRIDYTGSSPSVVFQDNFESDRGWTLTPNQNTATTGRWQRGDPQPTTLNGVALQLNTCAGNSVNCLITGLSAGAGAGANDVDGGLTSIQSPAITLPASGTITLNFNYYFAHVSSSRADFFRVRVIGSSGTPQTVFQESGNSNNDAAAWASRSVALTTYAGQTVRLLFEASDTSTSSYVEAGVDNVVVTRQ